MPRKTDYRLLIAAEDGNVDKIHALLSEGADINVAIAEKYDSIFSNLTPLMVAIINNQIKAAEVILQYQPDINKKDPDGYTALHFAAKDNLIQAVRMLLDSGADPYIENADEQTALDLTDDKSIESMLRQAMAGLQPSSVKNSHVLHKALSCLKDPDDITEFDI